VIGPRVPICERPHRITLSNPGEPVVDPDGGYTEGLAPLDPPQLSVQIRAASASDIEAQFAGTVVATATHIITGPYHPGVTQETVIEFEGRTFHVLNRVNVDERDQELVLLVAEQVT